MKNKFILFLLGTALCSGGFLSLVNIHINNSLTIMNVEALSRLIGVYSYYNGVAIETAQSPNTGTCGLVYVDPDSHLLTALCKISLQEKDNCYKWYKGQAWCCDNCANTTYCDYLY
jgi:hypothetical protein